MSDKYQALKAAKSFIGEHIDEFNHLVQGQYGVGLTRSFEEELSAFLNEINSNPNATIEYVKDPERLKRAFMEIARLGLSLVRESGMVFAYLTLTPKGFHVFSSYNGLIRLAVLSESIRVTTASCVHVNDDNFRVFTRDDGSQAIEHEYGLMTLRNGRGDIVGAYCSTEFTSGVKTSSIVDINEVLRIRAMADSSFWDTFFDQMACKTAVRKEAKNWIRFGKNTRLLAGLLDHESDLSDTEFPNNPTNQYKGSAGERSENGNAPVGKRSMSYLRKRA